MLTALLIGVLILAAVWTGMAASNLSAHFQHKRDVTETPDEKASREANARRRAAGIED